MTPTFDFTDQISTHLELLNQLCSLSLFCLLVYVAYKLFIRHLPLMESSTSLKLISLFALMTGVSLTVFFWTMSETSDYFVTLVISLILGFSVFHPALAITSICGLLILRAWEIRPDMEVLAILPRVALLVFIVSYLLAAVRERRFQFVFSKVQVGILCVGLWVFLSTITSDKAVDSQAAFFEGYFKSLVICFLIFQSVRNTRHYETVVGGLVVAVFGIAVLALFNTFFVHETPRLELLGAMKNSNDLASVFIFVLPFAVRSFWSKGTGVSQRFFATGLQTILKLVMAVVLLAAIWKAQSRAAYLAIFCMGIMWLAFKVRHQKKFLLVGLVAGLIGIGVLSGLQLGRDSSDLEGSRQNRLGYWKAGVSMALRNPILGVGYGRFPFRYQSYGDGAFTEYGQRTAHSSWILLVSEAGIPALILFVGLFVLAFQRAWQLGEVAPELLISLTGYAVAMSFLSHVYTIYPYILLALIFSFPRKEVFA